MRRAFLRLALAPLAALFLLEAWLWDHLALPVAWLVAHIPLERWKHSLGVRVAHLSPGATLCVFALPLFVLFPVKLLGFYFLGEGFWLLALGTFLAAKLLSVAVSAFLFQITREKLLLLRWFRVGYEWVLWARARSQEILAPIQAAIHRKARLLRPSRGRRAFRLLARVRRTIHHRVIDPSV